MADFEDQVDLPAEGLEFTEEEISFNDNGTVNDDVYVQDVAAPEVSAVVLEEEVAAPVEATVLHEEVVEETIPAPVAVIDEPEPTYVAPIEEPVHHVRWPWALLALPLLAIPFIPRHTTPVAEPVAVKEVVVREAPAVRSVPTVVVPECKGTWTVTGSEVLRSTAATNGAAVSTLAKGTAVDVKSSEAGWYKVTAGTESGYLPVNVVTCTEAAAPATKTMPVPKAPVSPKAAATTTVTG